MNAQAPSGLNPSPTPVAERSAIEAWRRRSGLIRFWRRALPAILGLIVLAVVGQLVVRGVLSATAPKDDAPSEIRIVNPRFLGRDQQGNAFTLTATDGVRVPGQEGLIRLNNPRLVLRGGDRPMTVTSRLGWWRERDEVAVMRGQVVMVNPAEGSTFRTEEALINTQNDVVSANSPITIVTRTQRISAQSYALYDGGDRVVLRGSVRARINNGVRLGAASSAE